MIRCIDQLLVLLSATQRFPPDDTTRDVLARAEKRLMVLHRRCTQLNKPFVVATVGLGNVGKSTLMNALLGDEFAPVGNYPCTACPVEFSFGERLQVTVHWVDDYKPQRETFLNPADLLNHLVTVADEKQKTTDAQVSRVEVTAPLPILKDGLVLADTPGFNAVQMEDRHGAHQQVFTTVPLPRGAFATCRMNS